jgi:hypothetical protein
MNLEGDLDGLALCRRLEHATDRGSREAVAADEHRHVLLREDELEAEAFRPEFGDLELCLGRLVDEIHRHILEEVFQAIRHGLHKTQTLRGNGPRRKLTFWESTLAAIYDRGSLLFTVTSCHHFKKILQHG